MLVVHHLGRSQSDRIVWLCEELGLPYELKRYAREPTGAAPPAYKALHSFGTAPVIQDGDVVLGESSAIVEYICRKHGIGRLTAEPSASNFAQYLYWFHFAKRANRLERGRDPVQARRSDVAGERALEVP